MDEVARRRPVVTVAVVSWNTRDLLLRCLRSLEPEVRAGRARVCVVDNGSDDGSADAAREQAPWAQVLEPSGNIGFGRAVNLVAATAQTEWLACANADVALEPRALEALLAASAGDDRVACVAPRLVLPDGQTQHSVYPLPTIPFTLALNLGLHRLSRRLGDRLCLEGLWDPDREREVPWAIGAFLLLRREAFEHVGRFDARQWVYGEDLDLGWRLRRAGFLTRYEPRARVRHASGAATVTAFGEERLARFTRATYAVILRRRGLLRMRITAIINVLGAAARIAWMTPLAVLSTRFREARTVSRQWLDAHRQGLHSAAEILGDH